MSIVKLLATCFISFLILELLVTSFFEGKVYTAVFFIAGIVGAVVISCNIPGLSMVPAFMGILLVFIRIHFNACSDP